MLPLLFKVFILMMPVLVLVLVLWILVSQT